MQNSVLIVWEINLKIVPVLKEGNRWYKILQKTATVWIINTSMFGISIITIAHSIKSSATTKIFVTLRQ